ncbi:MULTISPECIES: hypothetical protein [unclassified Microbacterium]|uniref:hypothetical protein n=1 Tax=unclassified Microbacterium TaxID=2609290 RepID=UPI0006F4746D|nr:MULTISPECIES: hypothetical protein [unclassified Microbacterium]KRD50537.1 hypothetical protein ASE34_13370 [Microbacterium sp. Root280D1]
MREFTCGPERETAYWVSDVNADRGSDSRSQPNEEKRCCSGAEHHLGVRCKIGVVSDEYVYTEPLCKPLTEATVTGVPTGRADSHTEGATIDLAQ